MKKRFISAQVLLNKDDRSMKAQRVYSIPKPAVVSIYLEAYENDGEIVLVGVLVQDWNTSDCLDRHPELSRLIETLEKHFGLTVFGGYENV